MTIKKDKYSFSTQKDIIQFLNELENRFPVNKWICNGVHIWPVIRLRLADNMLEYMRSGSAIPSKIEIKKSVGRGNFFKKVIRNLDKVRCSAKYAQWQKSLHSDADILFVGAPHYREEVEGVRKNKFFDPLIEEYGIEHFYWFDIGSPVQNPSWPDRMLDFENGSAWFMKYRSLLRSLRLVKQTPNLELPQYENFREYLRTIQPATSFALEYTSKKLGKVMMEWHDYYLLFQRMLSRIKPERVLLLCYFDLPRTALTAAATRMDIPVTEMQHGTVDTKYYQRWFNLPEQGYDMLPRTFWCWDRYSKETLDEWAAKHPRYKTFVGGNPWVNYWIRRGSNAELNGQFILYTLQDLNPDDAFPPDLLKVMHETEETWYIRLHPRFLHFKEEIVALLTNNHLINKTNFKEANQLPLTVLLQQTVLHITAHSSSAMEASVFGVKTFFLDEISKEWFPALFRNQLCKYMDPSSKAFISQFVEYYKEVKRNSGDTSKTTLDNEAIAWILNRSSKQLKKNL